MLFGIFIGVLIVGFYYFLYADKYGLRKDKYGYFKELTAVVYKTPNCNCCENYISYLRSNGFKVEKKEVSDEELTNLKKQIGIPENLWSCHTVFLYTDYADFKRINTDKSFNENPRLSALDPRQSAYVYFIEGHIPIEAINKLLTEKPEINGIALPQMPSGSPGMPGFKIEKWKIHSIKNGQDQGIFMEI